MSMSVSSSTEHGFQRQAQSSLQSGASMTWTSMLQGFLLWVWPGETGEMVGIQVGPFSWQMLCRLMFG